MTILFLILALSGNVVELDWYQHYEMGVRAVEVGDSEKAILHLEKALALRPEAELNVPTSPLEYVDYTPHLFLSIAHQMRGEIVSARDELSKAEAEGVAEMSEHGKYLLQSQRILLTGLASKPLPARPDFSGYWNRPALLTESEFETLKTDILEHCDTAYEPAPGDTKWYSHYEASLDASRSGQNEKALLELLESVVRRPQPQRRARTYGMWLVDYYPYFQIAKLHARMGNWSCARDAISISKRLDEIAPSSNEFTEFVMLDYESQRKQ